MISKMRRNRQQLSEAEAQAIMTRGSSGVLALELPDSYPYAVPISYVWHNDRIYFHGSKHGMKAEAVRRGGKASFCVIDQDEIVPQEYTTYFRSAIAFGHLRELTEEDELLQALRLLADKYYPEADTGYRQDAIRRERSGVMVFELLVEHLTGKEAIELVRRRENLLKGNCV